MAACSILSKAFSISVTPQNFHFGLWISFWINYPSSTYFDNFSEFSGNYSHFFLELNPFSGKFYNLFHEIQVFLLELLVSQIVPRIFFGIFGIFWNIYISIKRFFYIYFKFKNIFWAIETLSLFFADWIQLVSPFYPLLSNMASWSQSCSKKVSLLIFQQSSDD